MAPQSTRGGRPSPADSVRSANITSLLWGLLCLPLLFAVPGPPLVDQSWLDTVFLSVVAALLGTASIQLRYGIINMSGAAVSAAVAVLSPLQAMIVGLAGQADRAWRRRRTDPIPSNLGSGLWGAGGAAVRYACLKHHLWLPEAVGVALLVGVGINVITVAVSLSFRTETPVPKILTQILTPGFGFAYTYFLVAGSLASTMLGHSFEGLLRASGLFLLAIAVGDSVGGRTIRAFLERQLVAVEPHVQYSQLAKGTFHDLRNHIGAALANLRSIAWSTLDLESRTAISTAVAALEDAVQVLAEAEPSGRATGYSDFGQTEMGELCRHIAQLHRRVAGLRRIQLDVEIGDVEHVVFGQPVLLGEVITNLILNAIDASPDGSQILVRCTSDSDGTTVTVSDSGAGASDDAMNRMFEPGFTTKAERGSGLGLYTALGIARQHHGDLTYAPPSWTQSVVGLPGATFILVLPTHEVGRQILAGADGAAHRVASQARRA